MTVLCLSFVVPFVFKLFDPKQGNKNLRPSAFSDDVQKHPDHFDVTGAPPEEHEVPDDVAEFGSSSCFIWSRCFFTPKAPNERGRM